MDFFKKNRMIVSVVAICCLMLWYVLWTTLAVLHINRQIDYVAGHPYKAMSEVSRIQGVVSQTTAYFSRCADEEPKITAGLKRSLSGESL